MPTTQNGDRQTEVGARRRRAPTSFCLSPALQEEYRQLQTKLVKGRVTLLCVVALGIYFAASFFLLFIRPEEFKTEEIPVWALLLLAGGLVLFLNRRAGTLKGAKANGLLFTALVLALFVRLGLIYPEDLAYSSIYYVFTFFLVCHTLPWTAGEVIFLWPLHAAAYSILFTLRTGLLKGMSGIHFDPYVDGLILLVVAFVMGYVIRRKETGRDLENFSLLKEVEAKNEQTQKELELARRIHKTLIPNSISTDRADITVTYLPVQTIGGDYAKFHFLGEDHLLFIISDVTGHGVPAALLVNRLHTEFERLAKEVKEPGLLLKELDRFITEDFEGTHMYLTAFCGLLNFRSGDFLYSNYGHPPQYLYHASQGEVHRLSPQTTLLGLSFRDQQVYQSRVSFGRGDRLLLFTDGLTESRGAGGEAFGFERLETFLKKNDSIPHPRFNESLLEELKAYKKGEFKDDIFILSIKIN